MSGSRLLSLLVKSHEQLGGYRRELGGTVGKMSHSAQKIVSNTGL